MTTVHRPPKLRAMFLGSTSVEADSPEPPDVAGSRRPQVLVADRDCDLLELIAHTFQRAGLRTFGAHDESSALALFASLRPAVVVLDTNGLDMLEPLRHAGREMAIIVLTANADAEARIRALERGADYYLTKPFSPRELLALVRACLRRSDPDSSLAATPGRRTCA